MDKGIMFLVYKEGKVLLEKRPENDVRAQGLTTIPCGNMKDDETPEDTLRREVREELDVEVAEFFLLDTFVNLSLNGEQFETYAFLVTELDGEITNVGNEGEHIWVTLEEADEILKLSGFRLPLFLARQKITQ